MMSLRWTAEMLTDGFIQRTKFQEYEVDFQEQEADLGSLAAFVIRDRAVSTCDHSEDRGLNPGETEPNQGWEVKMKATKKEQPQR